MMIFKNYHSAFIVCASRCCVARDNNHLFLPLFVFLDKVIEQIVKLKAIAGAKTLPKQLKFHRSNSRSSLYLFCFFIRCAIYSRSPFTILSSRNRVIIPWHLSLPSHKNKNQFSDTRITHTLWYVVHCRDGYRGVYVLRGKKRMKRCAELTSVASNIGWRRCNTVLSSSSRNSAPFILE